MTETKHKAVVATAALADRFAVALVILETPRRPLKISDRRRRQGSRG